LTEEQQAGTTPETMSEANAPEVVSVAEPATVVADVAAETPEPSMIEPAAEEASAPEPEPADEPEADAVAAPADDVVAEAVAEPVAEAPADVAVEPMAAAEPVADVAAEPVVVAKPVAEPVAEAGPDGVSPEDLADAPAAEEPDVVVPAPAARPEPSTMEELLAEQDTDIRSFKHGDVVEGAIVRIDKDEILVDIGAKSEGVVSNRELYGRNAESSPVLAVGDVVLVYVLQPESPEGHVVLSLRRAGLERKWRSMQEQFETGIIIEAPVIDHNKGGLIVDCGIRGFVPISQIVDFPRRPQNEQPRDAAQEIAEKLQPYVGRRLRLKILEVNRKANRLILSEKVALYEERREKRDELFSSLQVGQKVKGNIRSIAPFGVFVDLGGIDGLVHKSELSWNKVNNPEAGYKVGEEVEAEVIDINHERGRISLSIRRLQPDPWHSTVADFKVGEVIDGTVTKLVNFGAFVRVRDGLEGLIHISELSHQRVAHPGDVVREGQTIKLKIISLDSERHRLGLSLKQAEEAPARPALEAPRPRRPREERGYAMSDAVQEPEGGIDNTLAAAFAQVRQQLEQAEKAEQRSAEAAPEVEPEPVAGSEAVAAEPEPAVESEPVAEAVTVPEPEPVAEEIAAESEPVAEAVTVPEAETVEEEPVAVPDANPAPESEADLAAEPAPEV
jgi:small subunit ribosomal protein S1